MVLPFLKSQHLRFGLDLKKTNLTPIEWNVIFIYAMINMIFKLFQPDHKTFIVRRTDILLQNRN